MLLVALGAISFIAPLSTPTRCAACCAVSETPQYFHAVASFPRVPHDSGFRSPRSAVTIKCLVTEADVEGAVEKAEKAWEAALAAREKADELSTKAEEMAEASAATSEAASAKVDASTTFKMSQLGDLKAATDETLDANAMLAEAVDAAEEADRLEVLAEEATALMEEALEQHLVDYPDSELNDADE